MIFNNFGFNRVAGSLALVPTPTPTPTPTITPTPVPGIISDSVMIWLDPANASSYNGGNISSGTGAVGTWNSVSGSTNNVAPFTIYRYSGGLTKSANWFSTTGDFRFQTTNHLPDPPAGLWTIEMWVNPTLKRQTNWSLFTQQVGTPNSINYLLSNAYQGGGLNLYAGGFANGVYRLSPSGLAIPVNAGWKHIVGTASTGSNGTYTIYYNGVQQVQSTNIGTIGTSTSTTSLTFINNDTGQNGGSWEASWGQVRMYSRPLTAAEVLNNFNVTKAIYGVA